MINQENWHLYTYASADKLAFISTIGEQVGDDVAFFYAVTLLSTSGAELYQETFPDLDKAITAMQDRYGHWEKKGRNLLDEPSSCDSCGS